VPCHKPKQFWFLGDGGPAKSDVSGLRCHEEHEELFCDAEGVDGSAGACQSKLGGRLEAEAKLGSDFAARVASAKAITDAAAAYQEWMTRRMELLSKEWQKAVEDGQKFMNACTRIAGNGKGFGGP
jgi:hypothetical protein